MTTAASAIKEHFSTLESQPLPGDKDDDSERFESEETGSGEEDLEMTLPLNIEDDEMYQRLIQLSFAKIVNSKHERGGAKLHKNLLVLHLLKRARNEQRRSLSPSDMDTSIIIRQDGEEEEEEDNQLTEDKPSESTDLDESSTEHQETEDELFEELVTVTLDSGSMSNQAHSDDKNDTFSPEPTNAGEPLKEGSGVEDTEMEERPRVIIQRCDDLITPYSQSSFYTSHDSEEIGDKGKCAEAVAEGTSTSQSSSGYSESNQPDRTSKSEFEVPRTRRNHSSSSSGYDSGSTSASSSEEDDSDTSPPSSPSGPESVRRKRKHSLSHSSPSDSAEKPESGQKRSCTDQSGQLCGLISVFNSGLAGVTNSSDSSASSQPEDSTVQEDSSHCFVPATSSFLPLTCHS